MNRIDVQDNEIRVQAGALLSKTAAAAYEAGLTGAGVCFRHPGTVGGAVRMNAGAYGGEMKQVLKNASVLTPEGRILTLTADEMKMGYRTSIVSRMDYVVLEAVLTLTPGSREEIRGRMEKLKEQRVSKQPLEYGSAGSTFKRPEGYFAGKLIQDAGLRGFRVGNAQVSEKHCGFVINRGGATAKEVTELMDEVVRRVEEDSGSAAGTGSEEDRRVLTDAACNCNGNVRSGKVFGAEDAGGYGVFLRGQPAHPLLTRFVEMFSEPDEEVKKIALGIDVRGGQDFDGLKEVLDELDSRKTEYEILFLDAQDNVLVKRYKETRRSIP